MTIPTSVATSAPDFTAPQKARLQDALVKLAAFDEKLFEVERLRDAIRESARQFALGEINLAQAAAVAGIPPVAVADVRGALRTGVKALIRETIADLEDLIVQHRQHTVDDLAARCRKMEKAERENCRAIGIGDDDFRPSGLLEGLREQHRRTLRDSNGTITRGSLNDLAKACGLAAPAAAAPPAEVEEDEFEEALLGS